MNNIKASVDDEQAHLKSLIAFSLNFRPRIMAVKLTLGVLTVTLVLGMAMVSGRFVIIMMP